MTSTNSYSKTAFSVIRKEMRALLGCFVAVPIVNFIVTVVIAFSICSTTANKGYNITNSFSESQIIFTFTGLAIVSTIIVSQRYNFLFSRRKTDLVFAFPVKRTTNYFAKSIASVFLIIITYVSSVFADILVKYTVVNAYKLKYNLNLGIKIAVIGAISSICIYLIAQMCVTVSGKSWHYWCQLVGLLLFSTVGMNSILVMPSLFLFGASREITNIGNLFMPLTYIFSATSGAVRMRYLLLSGLIVAAIALFAGLYFYKKRQSECSEQSLSNNAIAIFASLSAALSFTILPRYIKSLTASKWLLFSVLAIIIVAVVMFACNIVYYRKPFSKGMGFTTLFACVLLFVAISVMSNDNIGCAKIIEDENQIESIRVENHYTENIIAGDVYDIGVQYNDVDSSAFIGYNTWVSKLKITDPNSIKDIIELQKNCKQDNKTSSFSDYYPNIKLKIKLKNGKKQVKILKMTKNYQPLLSALKESKKEQTFVKDYSVKDVCFITNISDESKKYDVSTVFPVLVDEYMSLTQNDFNALCNSLSAFSVNVYAVNPNIDKNIYDKLKGYSYQQLSDYYYSYNGSEPSPVIIDTISVVVKSDKLKSILKKEKLLANITDFNKVNVKNIDSMYVAKVWQKDSIGCYGVNDYNYINADLKTIFDFTPFLKSFELDSASYFSSVYSKNDYDAVKKTFDSVNSKGNQYSQFVKNNFSGYVVVFKLKDGSYTKMMFTKNVYGIDDLNDNVDAFEGDF